MLLIYPCFSHKKPEIKLLHVLVLIFTEGCYQYISFIFIFFFCYQSTVTVDKNLQELRELMQDLPDYADQFLNMICNTLKEYRDTCHSAYRGQYMYKQAHWAPVIY